MIDANVSVDGLNVKAYIKRAKNVGEQNGSVKICLQENTFGISVS